MVEIDATEAARSFGQKIDRCLQGETFSVSRRGGPPLVRIMAAGKPSLAGLPDELVVSLNLWLLLEYKPNGVPASLDSVRPLLNAVCEAAEDRGWPEGWYEDPSVIPGLYTKSETGSLTFTASRDATERRRST